MKIKLCKDCRYSCTFLIPYEYRTPAYNFVVCNVGHLNPHPLDQHAPLMYWTSGLVADGFNRICTVDLQEAALYKYSDLVFIGVDAKPCVFYLVECDPTTPAEWKQALIVKRVAKAIPSVRINTLAQPYDEI